MRKVLSLVALAALATTVPAQEHLAQRFELRPYAGALVPTGAMRDIIESAPLFGAQAAFQLRPGWHVTGTFGWIPTHNRFDVGDDGVNIYQYDLGMEIARVRPMDDGWTLKPYFALGGGARTYDYQAVELGSKTCLAGYGALGSEFQVSRYALRVEARDNLTCFKSPIVGEKSVTRNDVQFALGFAYHFW